MNQYRIRHKPSGKFCKAGLIPVRGPGKTWLCRGHAVNAIKCQSPYFRLADYEVVEVATQEIRTIPASEFIK